MMKTASYHKDYENKPLVTDAQHDEFSLHELMDRAFLVMDTFDNFILEHDIVQADPKLEERASIVFNQLADFYQDIGALRFAKIE